MKQFLARLSIILIMGLSPAAHSTSTTVQSNIADTADTIRPILPGQRLTNVCLQTLVKKQICTDALLKSQPTVLVVYRGGWCPYCNGQLNRLKRIEGRLKSLGYQIVAVSPDSNKNISEQQKREQLNYELLTDNTLSLAKALGLAYFLDTETQARYQGKLGIPFVSVEGEKRVSLPVPAVFIFDTQGMVHFQYVNPNYKTRLDEDVLLLAATKALKVM
jgi:peroxiredoxin